MVIPRDFLDSIELDARSPRGRVAVRAIHGSLDVLAYLAGEFALGGLALRSALRR